MYESPPASEAADTPETPRVELPQPQRLIVTPTLVAMNVAYFLAMVSVGVSATNPTPGEALLFGANFGPFTMNGEWWRLLSSTFIHFGVLHLAFNMWCLWSLGNLAERLFGKGPFLLIYLLTGLSGSTASLLWHPVVVSAGASGAVFGIAGALATFLYLGHIHLPQRAARDLLTSIMVFIAFNLAFGLTIPGIDNAGHLGGLILGAILGAALRYRSVFPAVASGAVACLIGAAFLAKSLASADPNMLLAEARMLLVTDRPAAIQKVEQATVQHPTFAVGHTALAQLYLEEDRYDDAIQASRKALELDSQLGEAQRVLGIALHEKGDHEAAVDELRKTIELDPKQLDAHATLSRSLRALGQDDEAMVALEEGVKYAPTPTLLFLGLGLENLDDVELEFLVATLDQEIEITPEDPENYNVLSLVLARTGAHDRALEAVQKALELRPNAPHIIDSLGTVHFYRGELDDAVEAYAKAVELADNSAVYHYNLSIALRGRGDTAEADTELAEARRLVPTLVPPADGHPFM